jgi:hypothetical protein
MGAGIGGRARGVAHFKFNGYGRRVERVNWERWAAEPQPEDAFGPLSPHGSSQDGRALAKSKSVRQNSCEFSALRPPRNEGATPKPTMHREQKKAPEVPGLSVQRRKHLEGILGAPMLSQSTNRARRGARSMRQVA